MKRIVYLIISVVVLMSFIGCGHMVGSTKAAIKSNGVSHYQDGNLIRIGETKVDRIEDQFLSITKEYINNKILKFNVTLISNQYLEREEFYEKIGTYNIYRSSCTDSWARDIFFSIIALGVPGLDALLREAPLENTEEKVVGETKRIRARTYRIVKPISKLPLKLDCGATGIYTLLTDENGNAELNISPLLNQLTSNYDWKISVYANYNQLHKKEIFVLHTTDLGVTWDKPRYVSGNLPNLEILSISFSDLDKKGFLEAGDSGEILVSIKNKGKGPAWDVVLKLESPLKENITYPEQIKIGMLKPNEEQIIRIPFSSTLDLKASQINIKTTLLESNGFDSIPVMLSLNAVAYRQPNLQVAKVDLMDSDGRHIISKGKEITIDLSIQNTGEGLAKEVECLIESGDPNIKIFSDNAVRFKEIRPGGNHKAQFIIVVTQRYNGSKVLPINFVLKERVQLQKPILELTLGEEAPQIKIIKVAAKVPEFKTFTIEDIDSPPIIDPSQKEFKDSDVAVVIGIEKYQNLPKSDFSYNDAKAIKAYLLQLGFAERNIDLILDEKATKSGIEKSLENWLPNRTSKDKRVFIYYSGHGAPDPETGQAYIVPHDGDPNYLMATGYPLRRMYAQLQNYNTKEIIIIMDSCFSGVGGRSVSVKGARPLVIKTEEFILSSNMAVLSGAQGSQISTSSSEKSHGVFTYYFLKSIKDGKKNLAEIYDFIKPQVENEAKSLNVQQSPSLNPPRERITAGFVLRR